MPDGFPHRHDGSKHGKLDVGGLIVTCRVELHVEVEGRFFCPTKPKSDYQLVLDSFRLEDERTSRVSDFVNANVIPRLEYGLGTPSRSELTLLVLLAHQ